MWILWISSTRHLHQRIKPYLIHNCRSFGSWSNEPIALRLYLQSSLWLEEHSLPHVPGIKEEKGRYSRFPFLGMSPWHNFLQRNPASQIFHYFSTMPKSLDQYFNLGQTRTFIQMIAGVIFKLSASWLPDYTKVKPYLSPLPSQLESLYIIDHFLQEIDLGFCFSALLKLQRIYEQRSVFLCPNYIYILY